MDPGPYRRPNKMLSRIRNRQKGFTLIELLIVVAIIGIIAALLIPNFLDALQKAKQKRTVADVRNAGTAMFSWLTDQVGAAAAGATATEVSLSSANYGTALTAGGITALLVPQYLQSVPEKDGWKNTYSYYMHTSNVLAQTVLAVRFQCRGGSSITDHHTVGRFRPPHYRPGIL